MAVCVIKVCRNYKGRLKSNKNVTYHRIPSDPVLKNKWIAIIRKSRREDFWKPAKSACICSDHFRQKDLYFPKNQGRRRLRKGAIPCKALFLSSHETEDEEDDDIDDLHEENTTNNSVTNVTNDAGLFLSSFKIDDEGDDEKDNLHDENTTDNSVTNVSDNTIFFISPLETDDEEDSEKDHLHEENTTNNSVTNVSEDAKKSAGNEEGYFGVTKNIPSSFIETSDNITGIVSVSTSSCVPGQASDSKNEDERRKENESDIIEDFSDLDSVYDSPKETKLRKDLQKKIQLQKKHTSKIQSLRRKNLRLKKRIASLTKTVGTLKKEIYELKHS